MTAPQWPGTSLSAESCREALKRELRGLRGLDAAVCVW